MDATVTASIRSVRGTREGGKEPPSFQASPMRTERIPRCASCPDAPMRWRCVEQAVGLFAELIGRKFGRHAAPCRVRLVFRRTGRTCGERKWPVVCSTRHRSARGSGGGCVNRNVAGRRGQTRDRDTEQHDMIHNLTWVMGHAHGPRHTSQLTEVSTHGPRGARSARLKTTPGRGGAFAMMPARCTHHAAVDYMPALPSRMHALVKSLVLYAALVLSRARGNTPPS